jgi:hypothetical protein
MNLVHRQDRKSSTRRAKTVRRTLTILLLVIGAALAGLWLRSYKTADRLHGRLWGRHSFVIASKQGRLTTVGFLSHAPPGWWKWETRSYPADDDMSFPAGDVKQYDNWLGFGTIRNPIYFVMRPVQEMPDGTTMHFWGAATATLRGSGVIIPYWLLLGLTVLAVAALRVRRWRYSLRTLFIVVTLLALLLGLMKLMQ